jgi:predicted Kef-type K+ transport protein
VFRRLLEFEKERAEMALEMGVRLGQFSEFAFLIAVIAVSSGAIGERASAVIQLATLLTFVISAYWTVARYPTPIAVRDSLRRD